MLAKVTPQQFVGKPNLRYCCIANHKFVCFYCCLNGKNSIYFDIKVSDEANTKADKVQYIRDACDAFSGVLGDLHSESGKM